MEEETEHEPEAEPEPETAISDIPENPSPAAPETETSPPKISCCVNCEVELREEDQVTEFLAVFSDCERNVSLSEALGSVFALRKQKQKNDPPPPPVTVLHMCVKCAEILATLYKAYVELMEQSKATAYLTRIIRQVQLWHIQHGHTIPAHFRYASKEESEYRFVNSVLAVEFGESTITNDDDDDEDVISEDDIPISARKSFRRRESVNESRRIVDDDTDDENDDDETLLMSPRKNTETEIRTIPKKRKIIEPEEVEDDEVHDDNFTEEFQNRSKSKRKSSIPVKIPTPDEQILTGDEEDSVPVDSIKRKLIRKRGKRTATLSRAKRMAGRKQKKKGRPSGRIRKTKLRESSEVVENPIEGELGVAETTEGPEGVEGDSDTSKPSISTELKLGTKGKAHMVKVPKIDCPQCDSKFIYHWMLENHTLAVHEKVPPLDCTVCGLQFFKEDLLAKHTCIALELQEEERKKRPYTCKQCGKTFLLLKHVKQHYKCHDEGKPFQCNSCPSSFKSENFLRFHEKLHTEEKSWQCSICGKVFHVKRNLTIHMDIHEVEKKYLCSQCGEKFAQQKALRRHISAQHDTNLKHKCPICGKGFKRKDHIKQHLSSKVHPRPNEGEPTITIITPRNTKGSGGKAAASAALGHPLSTSSPVFIKHDNTQVFHIQPPGGTTHTPPFFHPIPQHFLSSSASAQPPSNQPQNSRSAPDFAFSDFMSFE